MSIGLMTIAFTVAFIVAGSYRHGVGSYRHGTVQAEKVLETKWLLKLNGDYSSEDGSDDADYKLNDGDGFSRVANNPLPFNFLRLLANGTFRCRCNQCKKNTLTAQ